MSKDPAPEHQRTPTAESGPGLNVPSLRIDGGRRRALRSVLLAVVACSAACNDGFNFVRKKKTGRFETPLRSNGIPRNLKVGFEVDFKDEDLKEEFLPKRDAVAERARAAVSRRSFKELKAPNGMQIIRGDIRREVEREMGEGTVANIIVTEFLLE